MKIRLIFSTLCLTLLALFLNNCSGLPTTTHIYTKNSLNSPPRFIDLVLDKPAELETMRPEIIIRVKSLFEEKLAEKNIALDANSPISLKVSFKKYEDGDLGARVITGLILGITAGELAKIEAEVIILNKKEAKEIVRADVAVRSSRSGWNFSYGYSGAKGLEKEFIKKVIDLI